LRPTDALFNYIPGQPEIILVSSSISENLQDRVDEELKHFSEAFAAALRAETSPNLENLADAADRLMRAVGRVLIEVRRTLEERGA
jgi:hypothetical protein